MDSSSFKLLKEDAGKYHIQHKDGRVFIVEKQDLSDESKNLINQIKNNIERKILKVNKGPNGLFIQTKESGPEREVVESHNRDRFANHFHYADKIQGNTKTFDSNGRYNCGACNMANGIKCLLVNNGKDDKPLIIDLEAGSCGDWEKKCAGDTEMFLYEKTPDAASYGVAKNGVGFGCKRCPYASAAYKPDSQARSLYCGKGDFRVFPNACCAINGAPVKNINYEKG